MNIDLGVLAASRVIICLFFNNIFKGAIHTYLLVLVATHRSSTTFATGYQKYYPTL